MYLSAQKYLVACPQKSLYYSIKLKFLNDRFVNEGNVKFDDLAGSQQSVIKYFKRFCSNKSVFLCRMN